MPNPSLQHTLKTQGRVWLRQALGQADLAAFDAATATSRRTLRIDYSADALPTPLAWTF